MFKMQNPLVLGGIGILGISIATGGLQDFQSTREYGQVVKEQRRELSQERLQMQLTEAELKQEAEIAKSRYQNGCVLVVSTMNPTRAATIKDGEPVIDMALGRPLSDGRPVCDTLGMTGFIKDGVVTDTAYTGDRSVVEEAMIRQGYGAQQLNPGQQ